MLTAVRGLAIPRHHILLLYHVGAMREGQMGKRAQNDNLPALARTSVELGRSGGAVSLAGKPR